MECDSKLASNSVVHSAGGRSITLHSSGRIQVLLEWKLTGRSKTPPPPLYQFYLITKTKKVNSLLTSLLSSELTLEESDM